MVEHLAHWLSCPECGARATDEDGGVFILDRDNDRTKLECEECQTEEYVKASVHPVFEWDNPTREGLVRFDNQ